MKKITKAPKVNIIRFAYNDIIATSSEIGFGSEATDGMEADVQGRHHSSIWD